MAANTTTNVPQPLEPIPREPISENSNWRNWFNNLALNGSIITQRVTNNVLTTDAGGNIYNGATNLATGNVFYINTQQLADAAVTTAKIGQQVIQTGNINPGAITQGLIASGAVGWQQAAPGLTFVNIVSSLPALPDPQYPAGSTVSLTTDGKIYRNVSGAWTAAVNGVDISPGTVGYSAFASGTYPITVVSSLPTLPNSNFPVGAVVSNSTDGKIYRNISGAWQTYINGTDIVANTITSGQIASNTIVANNIASGTITAAQIAANTITASQIAANTITASNIASNTITASQIASGTITSTQLASNTIVAGNIATGTITAASGILANASVGTLTIAGNSVTSMNYTALSTTFYVGGTHPYYGNIVSSTVTMPSGSTGLIIEGYIYWAGSGLVLAQITKNGSSLGVTGIYVNAATMGSYYIPVYISAFDPNPSGTNTYAIQALMNTGGPAYTSTAFMTITGGQR